MKEKKIRVLDIISYFDPKDFYIKKQMFSAPVPLLKTGEVVFLNKELGIFLKKDDIGFQFYDLKRNKVVDVRSARKQ